MKIYLAPTMIALGGIGWLDFFLNSNISNFIDLKKKNVNTISLERPLQFKQDLVREPSGEGSLIGQLLLMFEARK